MELPLTKMWKTEEKQVFWEEIESLVFGSVEFELPVSYLSICCYTGTGM